MLPEQRVAAVRPVEEVEAEAALELEEDVRRGQRGEREDEREDCARIPQQKSGIRFSDIPGARSLKIVTMKLIAPTVDEIVRKSSPRL